VTAHPGAFCSPAGGTDQTKTGTPMICTVVGPPGSRARWRRNGPAPTRTPRRRGGAPAASSTGGAALPVYDAGIVLDTSLDSVYADWSDEERAAADDMEERYNAGVRCEIAELVHTQYTRVAPDESLRRLATLYRRELEDLDCGDLIGGPARSRLARAKLTDVEREQQLRAALAATWQASETGTHCYSAYASRGGLAAVVYHGATPPSYRLAAMLDHANWARGLPHALTWTPRREASRAKGASR
jgi:hypothetical protein